MIDVDHQINAVRREVGTRVLEAGEGRTVTVRQIYDAVLEDVWDACTNAERIPRWFLPVSGDLREGGRYQLEGNASGTIQRCGPPRGFDTTWEYGGEISWIELRLSETQDGGTLFALSHIAPVGDTRWAEYGPGAVGVGWDLGLIGLVLHLASGVAVDREAALAWTASPEGREFMVRSSEGWRDAAVAAGDDEEAAQAAAARTIAAYTGAGAET